MNRFVFIAKQKTPKESVLLRSLISILVLLPVFILLQGCAGSQMSSEEARAVSLSTSKKNMEPPPRRIDDIINVLNQYSENDDSKVKEYREMLASSPPKNASDNELALYYNKIALGAVRVGDYNSCLKFIRTAYDYDKKDGKFNPDVRYHSAWFEDLFGNNYKTATERWMEVLKTSEYVGTYREVVRMHLQAGNLQVAEKFAIEARQLFNNSNTSSQLQRLLSINHMENINAMMLDAYGKSDEAGTHWIKAIDAAEQFKKERNGIYYDTKRFYIDYLINCGRYTFAEVEIRTLIKDTIAIRGKESAVCALALDQYCDILLHQGRINEAETIINRAVEIWNKWNIENNIWSVEFYKNYLDIACAREDYRKALEYYNISNKYSDSEEYILNRFYSQSKNLALAFALAGSKDEADKHIDWFYKKYSQNLGDEHIDTVEMRLLRGIVRIRDGRLSDGYRDYQTSLQKFIASRAEYSKSYSNKQRFRQILEAYLSFFSSIHQTKQETVFGIDASLEAFKIVEVLRQQSVQQALAANASRLAVQNVELSGLVRQEQDNGRMIAVLDRMLINHVSMAPEQQDPKVVSDLRAQIASLTAARTTLLTEIKQKFPDYENLVNPKPADYKTVAGFLRPHETLLSIFPSTERSYVWSIDDKGKVDFTVLPVGSKQIALGVQDLRRSLDLSCVKLGEIPEFDLKLSYWFYQTFLEPVKAGWSRKKDLLIVADGPLGGLPFSVLATQPYRLSQSSDLLFSEYRKAPWLVRQVSITRIPSVSALVGLRSLPPGDPSRKAFVGFGDPIFNASQVKAIQPTEVSAAMAKRGAQFQIRGVRVTQQGALDRANIVSNRLSMLNRLPDTAEEVISVSQSVRADREQDVFLGPKATEQMVRSLDLSNRRVVYFATHALVPGDIDGLHEPALALCAPEVAGSEEDGLLTAGEIMTLKLNADWVILSACNTAAAAGEGAEAISGLGRAFFYAGTRALLVSMWPVETSSARELTTRLFGIQNENPNLSRSGALRESMLQLIDGPGMVDKTSGKTIASYAHPFFWAPFIIVGDN